MPDKYHYQDVVIVIRQRDESGAICFVLQIGNSNFTFPGVISLDNVNAALSAANAWAEQHPEYPSVKPPERSRSLAETMSDLGWPWRWRGRA